AQYAHQFTSNGIADSDNLNDIILQISNNGGGTLLLTSPVYVIDKQIDYRKDVKIISQIGSVLRKQSGLIGAIFKSVDIDNVFLQGIVIDGNDKEVSGVSITGGRRHRIT